MDRKSMAGTTLQLKDRTPTPTAVRVGVAVLLGSALLLALVNVALFPGRPGMAAMLSLPMVGLLVLMTSLLLLAGAMSASPVTVECDERRVAVHAFAREGEIYWHSVKWARLHRAGDTRRDTRLVRDVGSTPPVFVMLQPVRPPYGPMSTAAGVPLAPKHWQLDFVGMGDVLDQVIRNCDDSAIDPTLVLLLGLIRRVESSVTAGETTPAIRAACAVDAIAVAKAPNAVPGDMAIKAIFSCLVGRRSDVSRALELTDTALRAAPDSWDLLLCRAICLRGQSSGDAPELMGPVLAFRNLPASVQASLEAAARAGTDAWFDPFV
jgi:hypothetical protein